jgi:magnesium chelatase family protein
MDRIDMQVEILPVSFEDISNDVQGEKSETIRKRVIAARQIQTSRFVEEANVYCNAQMGPKQMAKYAKLSPECVKILGDAMTKLDLSARAYDRIIRVARTIADLDASKEIEPSHIREAISYRNLDRSSWGVCSPKSI